MYDYNVIIDSWFLILKMKKNLAVPFYRFHVLEKQKINKANSQIDQVTWVDQHHVKVLRKTAIKIKASITEKKVLYFKEKFIFQGKCCILKKVLYLTERFIYLKENFVIKKEFLFL